MTDNDKKICNLSSSVVFLKFKQIYIYFYKIITICKKCKEHLDKQAAVAGVGEALSHVFMLKNFS